MKLRIKIFLFTFIVTTLSCSSSDTKESTSIPPIPKEDYKAIVKENLTTVQKEETWPQVRFKLFAPKQQGIYYLSSKYVQAENN